MGSLEEQALEACIKISQLVTDDEQIALFPNEFKEAYKVGEKYFERERKKRAEHMKGFEL